MSGLSWNCHSSRESLGDVDKKISGHMCLFSIRAKVLSVLGVILQTLSTKRLDAFQNPPQTIPHMSVPPDVMTQRSGEVRVLESSFGTHFVQLSACLTASWWRWMVKMTLSKPSPVGEDCRNQASHACDGSPCEQWGAWCSQTSIPFEWNLERWQECCTLTSKWSDTEETKETCVECDYDRKQQAEDGMSDGETGWHWLKLVNTLRRLSGVLGTWKVKCASLPGSAGQCWMCPRSPESSSEFLSSTWLDIYMRI